MIRVESFSYLSKASSAYYNIQQDQFFKGLDIFLFLLLITTNLKFKKMPIF